MGWGFRWSPSYHRGRRWRCICWHSYSLRRSCFFTCTGFFTHRLSMPECIRYTTSSTRPSPWQRTMHIRLKSLSATCSHSLGPLLLRTHVTVVWLWFVLAILGTQTHHCGYRLPWTLPFDHQPNFHDFHHEKFNNNFGLIGLLDWLHGTDRLWRQHLRRQRARTARAPVRTEPSL